MLEFMITSGPSWPCLGDPGRTMHTKGEKCGQVAEGPLPCVRACPASRGNALPLLFLVLLCVWGEPENETSYSDSIIIYL